MKHTLTLLSFLLLVCIGISANAGTLKGRITDENGDGLPFATVFEKGTTNGTSANGDGYFSLEIADGNRSVTAQYIGYLPTTKTVNVATDKGIVNFKLSPQTMNLGEVTVKASSEDPAYDIMRKVIAKRKYHADLIKSFETDVYLKGVIRLRETPKKIMGFKFSEQDKKDMGVDSNGKGVLYLLEQMTEYSYQAPDKEFNKVMSIRQSGDPQGVGFATMPPITNIYDNNVPIISGISKRGFISPANSNAFLYYKYKFMGTFMDGDRTINKIKVTPKRKFEPLFSGFVYVVDDEWVFQSVDLTLTKESQMDQLDTLRLEQTYIPVSKDLWVIQSQVIYPALKLLGFGGAGSMVTSYQNSRVNKPIKEDKFKGSFVSKYDSAANDRSLAYWDSIRPIPLEKDEIKDFIEKDSLNTSQKNKRDSLNKIPYTHLSPSSFLFGTPSVRRGNDTWTMESALNSISYNTVEGVNATLTLDWAHKINDNKSYSLELRNRYGFSNSHYNAMARFNYSSSDPKWRGRFWNFSIYGGKYVYQLNNSNPVTPFINELYTLLAGDNYMKLYERSFGKATVNRNWGNGFKASAFVSYEHRMPLENTTDYTFSESNKKDITPNNPVNLGTFETHNAAIVGLALSYQPGWRYIQYPKFKSPETSHAPIFTVRYQKGIPDIFNSKTDFDKWMVEMEHQLNLRLLGTVNYKLAAGGFFNDKYVGVPDMKHLFGDQTFLANPYLSSFQLAPYYRFSNTADIYGEGHVEWHLNGWLSNKIPLFRRLNWNLVGASNVLYIDNNNYYAEVSVGLENIGAKLFRFGRVDFVAGYQSGVSKPMVGIRIGLGDILWQLLGVSTVRE
jgi:hypothetical protein